MSLTAKMINQFQKHGYDRSLIEQQIDRANLQEREQLLKEKKKETATDISLLHHAHPATEPVVNKSYIQQCLEVTKQTEYFRSITT